MIIPGLSCFNIGSVRCERNRSGGGPNSLTSISGMKNLLKLFDFIKARPKFISHQRNSITH
jgi:hypothetical protein